MSSSMSDERFAEVINPVGVKFEARSHMMAPMGKQVLGADLERVVQREAGHGSTGALADNRPFARFGSHGDEQSRAGIEINQPARHDAENADVPVGIGEHKGRHLQIVRREHLLGLGEHATFDFLPFLILLFEITSQVLGSLG